MRELEITEHDIDHGQPCNSAECPLALAILRCLKPGALIQVNGGSVHFYVRSTLALICTINLPEPLVEFVALVDGHNTCGFPTPGSFEFPELFAAIKEHNL